MKTILVLIFLSFDAYAEHNSDSEELQEFIDESVERIYAFKELKDKMNEADERLVEALTKSFRADRKLEDNERFYRKVIDLLVEPPEIKKLKDGINIINIVQETTEKSAEESFIVKLEFDKARAEYNEKKKKLRIILVNRLREELNKANNN